MSLSWSKEDGGFALAITSSKSKLWNNKILYLNESQSSQQIKTKKVFTADEVSDYIPSRLKNRMKIIKQLTESLNSGENFNDENEQIQIIYETLKKKTNDTNFIELPQDTEFELLPRMQTDNKDGNLRTTLFVSGMAGSGKTYLCKNYILLYNEMYPSNKIYFISQQDKDLDPSLKEVKGMMEQISIEDLMSIEEPITWESFTKKPCLLFFDDYDGFSSNKSNKKQASPLKTVLSLIDDILRNGRKFGISCLISSHDLNKAQKNETILKECEYICVYPKGIMLYHLNYFGQKYLGLDKKQIQEIKKDRSRWIMIRRMFPMVQLTQYQCKILE